MSDTIKNYASAITGGDIRNIAATLSPAITVLPPGSNQPSEGSGKASMMLSAVAAVVAGFKLVRTYDSEDNWYTVSLEGALEGTTVQFIDQVHINDENLVDHIDIFLRPASMAQTLLGKVTEEIQKRTSA
jgi:hypothetical protein